MIKNKKLVKLQLSRNLIKRIKQGHAWVYREALRDLPNVPPGSPAVLLDNRGGREIARGYFTSNNPLALRICSTRTGEDLGQNWAIKKMNKALQLRKNLFGLNTTGYRLFNGEGDQLPGLVCDIYGDHAVIKLDGESAEGFWDTEMIAKWIVKNLEVETVVQNYRNRDQEKIKILIGNKPNQPIPFFENGVQFTADLLHGQKTGFFLDQRDNRQRIKSYAENNRVINVFGYTGGFSVFAGLAGAKHVSTLDIAKPALDLADKHWALNGLDLTKHESISADAFDYLSEMSKKGSKWDLVILDPPTFAPSEESVPKAVLAYTKLISLGAQITKRDSFLAAASCSSHITQNQFLDICAESISKAKRKARVLEVYSQPPDHPAPLVMPELRYLKFVMMQLD